MINLRSWVRTLTTWVTPSSASPEAARASATVDPFLDPPVKALRAIGGDQRRVSTREDEEEARFDTSRDGYATIMRMHQFSRGFETTLSKAETQLKSGPLDGETASQLRKFCKTALPGAEFALDRGQVVEASSLIDMLAKAQRALGVQPMLDESAKLQKVVVRALEMYRTALDPVKLDDGLMALALYKAAKAGQGAKLDEGDFAKMRSSLFDKQLVVYANEVITPKSGRNEHAPNSANEKMSSLLRSRDRAGFAISKDTLRLASQAWSAFSARDNVRLAELHNAPTPATLEAAAANDFKGLYDLTPANIDQMFTRFGFTADTLPDDARKMFTSVLSISIGHALSMTRTVLFDQNPYNAADGLSRIAAIETNVALAKRWNIDMSKDSDTADLSKLDAFKSEFESFKSAAAALDRAS